MTRGRCWTGTSSPSYEPLPTQRYVFYSSTKYHSSVCCHRRALETLPRGLHTSLPRHFIRVHSYPLITRGVDCIGVASGFNAHHIHGFEVFADTV